MEQSIEIMHTDVCVWRIKSEKNLLAISRPWTRFLCDNCLSTCNGQPYIESDLFAVILRKVDVFLNEINYFAYRYLHLHVS